MLHFIFGTISALSEPAFIEVKAALAGHLLAQPSWSAAVSALTGLLACLAIMNAVAYYEGAKALWTVFWIAEKLPLNDIEIAETIPASKLASEFGYAHQAFKFGPFAQNAGDLIILCDKTGRFLEYQCAFNMLGHSYLFVPSKKTLEEMPLYQKYLALHEIGHGSLTGGGIWTRSKSVVASGVIACVFGAITTELTALGGMAIGMTILSAFLSSVRVVLESEAEVYADSFAIRCLATTSPAAALKLVCKLIDRLQDVDHVLARYDQLVNKSRLRNLRIFEARLEAGKSLDSISHPSIRWLHYVAAALMLWWTFRDARPETFEWSLCVAFAALLVVGISIRNFTIPKMLILDRGIRIRIRS